MGKLRLQGVSWSEVTEQSIVKPWKVHWRGGKERHGSFREGQRMERGSWESAASFEDDAWSVWVASVKGWQEQGGWGAGGSAVLYIVLIRVYSGQRPFQRYYWRWCLRLTFWECQDVPETAFGECVMVSAKGSRSRLRSMVLTGASEQQSLDSPPWMLASHCLTLLQSCHFCFFHGHDLRVSIPDLLFTKDTLPSWTKNWCVCSLTPGTEISVSPLISLSDRIKSDAQMLLLG